jgi:hypothetical protein
MSHHSFRRGDEGFVTPFLNYFVKKSNTVGIDKLLAFGDGKSKMG